MTEKLEPEDWENILHALAQFRHNERFNATYEKVRRLMARED